LPAVSARFWENVGRENHHFSDQNQSPQLICMGTGITQTLWWQIMTPSKCANRAVSYFPFKK
jgi:hypothetical protein